MKKFVALVVAGLVLAPLPARAAVTFEYLFDNAFGTSISYDGTVVAGNSVSYIPFRWTQPTGVVLFQPSAVEIVGRSAGYAVVSADGKRVAATIASEDSLYVTAGLWELGSGWQQLEPMPPDSGIGDESLASVWGMSGDGRTVTGLYWRFGHPGGTAHASRWRQETGVIDLGHINNRSSRANGVSYNGEVIAGWGEHTTGYRQPIAWRGTTLMQLGGLSALGEGSCVSTTGEWVAGYETNLATNTREAALWHWDGSAWGATQYLGSVPGTSTSGLAVARAVSADGKLVVGYNTFDGDPFETTGFIWTDSTGCMDILFWLAEHDIEVDPNFDIKSLEAMTPDGKTLIGIGEVTNGPPYTRRTFRIQLDRNVLAVDPTPVATPANLELAIAPNPVRHNTTIGFTMPTAGAVELTLHDLSGRLVRRLAGSELAAGRHSYSWDRRDAGGSRVGSGVYFARLQAGSSRTTTKVVVTD